MSAHQTLSKTSLWAGLLLTSIICASAYILGWHTPLTTESEPIIPLQEATRHLTLSPTDTATQTIEVAPGPLRGLVVFTPAQALPVRSLHVEITDSTGTSRTIGTSNHIAYGEAKGTLTIPLEPITLSKPTKLTVTFQNQASTPIPLLTLADNQYGGELHKNNTPLRDYDLSLSLLRPHPASLATQQGILIGLSILLLLILFHLFQSVSIVAKYRWQVASGIVLLIATVASTPFIFTGERWGIGDWDYRFSLAHIYRETILTHHQFPFWNPYMCGGGAALGDPEFSVLTPTFILQLLLGVISGVKASLWLCFAVTSLGTLQLAWQLKRSPLAAILSAIIVTYSSALVLKMAEGHVTIVFAFMWLPWVLWSWVRAYQASASRSRFLFSAISGVFLTLMFFQGGVYILSYTAPVLLFLPIFVARTRQALRVTGLSAATGLGLAGIKLIPTLWWVWQFPDQHYVESTNTLRQLLDIFFGRYLHGTQLLLHQLSGWHEYGAYLGYGTLLLAIVGLSLFWRSRPVRLLTVLIVASVLMSALGSNLKPLFDQLSFMPRSNVSRLALFTVLGMGLLAGHGLDRLRQLLSPQSWIPALLAGIVAIDLLSLAYPIASQTFVIEPPFPSPAYEKPLLHTNETSPVKVDGLEHQRSYAYTLANQGTDTFCLVLGPRDESQRKSSENPQPAFVQSVSPHTNVTLRHWSPNTIKIEHDASTPDTVILNTNFATGWHVNNQPASNYQGRVAAPVTPDTKQLTFRYHPPGLIFGLLLTSGTIASIYLTWHRKYL